MDTAQPISLTRADALALRYGADTAPDGGPWNDTLAVMLAHRSVRGYRSDALPAGTLESLIAAAQSAATSSNLQTWSVVALTEPTSKAAIARLANNQRHIEQCPLFLAWIADLSRNARVAEQHGVALPALDYFETFLVAAIDAALAAQNATVAAESLGLSTVYIGALRNHPTEVAALLGLPPRAVAVFGLCVGYAAPAVASEVKPRLPQSVVLHRERYGAPDEQAALADYDAQMRVFAQRNEMAADTWSGRVIERLGRVSAMNGRDRLVAILRGLGFDLR